MEVKWLALRLAILHSPPRPFPIHLIGARVDHRVTLDCEEETKFCPYQDPNCDTSTVKSEVQLLCAVTGNCD